MQDIHTGFQDLNQVGETREFFQFLDAADALESIQTYRQWMLELCPPAKGQRILDVGCGVGHSTISLATLVGETGAVVGLDKSETLINEARRRAAEAGAPVTYQIGDARRLDFDARSFDLCRTERVLMYVDQPEQVLDEMLRVLRPGGMFAFFEFDYEAMIVDAPDRAFTRRVTRLVADSVPSPWIGRQLPRLLRERGVGELRVIPHMILTPYAMYCRVVSGTIAQGMQSGQLRAAELNMWWQALEQAEASGHFFAGVPAFFCVGARLQNLHERNATPVRGPNDGSSDDDDPCLAFVYQEAVRGLVHQQNVVESLNHRAGNLIFATAFVTSLLGTNGLRDGVGFWDWTALVLLFLIGALTVFMLWPYYDYTFRFDPEELLDRYIDGDAAASLGGMHRIGGI